jgi:hypothetical protein
MNPPEKLNQFLKPPRLTHTRIVLALAVAAIADGLQLFLGAVPFVDQAIDVIAMILVTWLIGFHILLLPTFVVKLIPIVDELPTWIACTIAVIALRKAEHSATPPPPPDKPVIDV